jgi:hypothetical protein
MNRWFKRKAVLGVFGAMLIASMGLGTVLASTTRTTFNIVRSKGAVAANCLVNAKARGTIQSLGPVERLTIEVEGVPPHTDFDVFVIQVPNSPFGIAWYQGDLKTDGHGQGSQSFLGRFSIETFAVATGTASAPVVFTAGALPDASSNPPFNPIHTYHLGLWFNSPAEAVAAGCPNTETPFNGPHDAGIQALSTNNFPDDHGPLRTIGS